MRTWLLGWYRPLRFAGRRALHPFLWAMALLALALAGAPSLGAGADPITIVTQPADQVVAPDQGATFSVVATVPAGTLRYQWYRVPQGRRPDAIRGAQSPNYTTPTLYLTQSGSEFFVRISDLRGHVTSRRALLTVRPAIVSPGADSAAGDMLAARFGHTATLLPNGLVLMAGVERDAFDQFPSPTAELYDPATGAFTATGEMLAATSLHTATLLWDGMVLVVGGYMNNSNPGFSLSQLYDPSTGSWTASDSMPLGRYAHTATLTPYGWVLVAGGGELIGIGISSLGYVVQ